jgi:hypothetical protein
MLKLLTAKMFLELGTIVVNVPMFTTLRSIWNKGN